MSTGEIVACARFAVQNFLSIMNLQYKYLLTIMQKDAVLPMTSLYKAVFLSMSQCCKDVFRTSSSMVIQDVWVIPGSTSSWFECVIETLHIWHNLTGITDPYCTQCFIEKNIFRVLLHAANFSQGAIVNYMTNVWVYRAHALVITFLSHGIDFCYHQLIGCTGTPSSVYITRYSASGGISYIQVRFYL